MEEKNKEVVKQYYHAINTKNWALLETLIHDEFGSSPMLEYIKEITETSINPFVEFFKILGYDENTIIDVQNFVLAVKDKQSSLNYIKWYSHYISNFDIQDIIAEKNRVWIYINSVFLASNKHKLNHSSFEHFIFRDSKIIASYGAGRYLGSLIQLGKVIIAGNDKEEINNYLHALRNLGIIPANI